MSSTGKPGKPTSKSTTEQPLPTWSDDEGTQTNVNPSALCREKEEDTKKWQISVSGFFETLVITCSDQQVFTGGAYAITLRYATACTISAYHYNIVTNMLLFTCATHLMSVTIAKHYWQHPYVAALRIAITTLVYIITGVIMSNQNSSSNKFPTQVPSPDG